MRRGRPGLSVAVVLLGILLTAAIPHPVAGQQDRTWLFGDVSFPAQVDSFLVLGTQRWADPARGTVLRFGSDRFAGATLDVHVQPLPPGGDDDAAVRQEFQRSLDELRRYSAGGITVAVDTVHAVRVEAGGRTWEGHTAAATLRGAETPGRSLAYVFAKPPSLVKIRITYDAAMRSTLDPRIQAFLAGILARVESFQNRRPAGEP